MGMGASTLFETLRQDLLFTPGHHGFSHPKGFLIVVFGYWFVETGVPCLPCETGQSIRTHHLGRNNKTFLDQAVDQLVQVVSVPKGPTLVLINGFQSLFSSLLSVEAKVFIEGAFGKRGSSNRQISFSPGQPIASRAGDRSIRRHITPSPLQGLVSIPGMSFFHIRPHPVL